MLHAFTAEESSELSVVKGEYVVSKLSCENEDGWIMVCRVKQPSDEGFVPFSYLQEVDQRKAVMHPSGCSIQISNDRSPPCNRNACGDNTTWKSSMHVNTSRSRNGSSSDRMGTSKNVSFSHSPLRDNSFPRKASTGTTNSHSGRRAWSVEKNTFTSCVPSSSAWKRRNTPIADISSSAALCPTCTRHSATGSPPSFRRGLPSEEGQFWGISFEEKRNCAFSPSSNEIELEKLKRQRLQSRNYITERLNDILTGVDECRSKTMLVIKNVEDLVDTMQDNHANWRKELADEKNRLQKPLPG